MDSPLGKESLDIFLAQRSSCPTPGSGLNTRMLKAKPLGCGMWEVREHGLNMGRGLRAEPAGKGQTTQIRNKGGFFLFFFFWIHFKKLN